MKKILDDDVSTAILKGNWNLMMASNNGDTARYTYRTISPVLNSVQTFINVFV